MTAMRWIFEKPQKGNPHRLRIKQHVWPKRSIERFVDAAGKVNLFDRARNKVRMAAADDDIFCAKRAWDQRAEIVTKSIEDEFQGLADEIIAANVTILDPKQKASVDAFYALWRARAEHRTTGADLTSLKNVTGHKWTKDQEEDFEKHGVWFIREDGTMPDRFLRGFRIQREIDALLPELSSAQWGIMRAQAGHLIVPDHPGLSPIIPLTPTLCLCWGQTGTTSMPWQQVAVINRYLNLVGHQYVFAQNLTQCPLNPHALWPQ
jgi:hypothetical protein